MDNQTLEQMRYPIGQFVAPESVTDKHIQLWIRDIELLPSQMRLAIAGMNDEQLDTPYRPEGWTVRQTVHHTADSHINGYIRLKLALTEQNPTIKPYEEHLWAELPDSKMDVDVSLKILDNVHARWVEILRGLTIDDFEKTFFHPASEKTFRIDVHAGTYSWHGRHHVAHIETLKLRMGWT